MIYDNFEEHLHLNESKLLKLEHAPAAGACSGACLRHKTFATYEKHFLSAEACLGRYLNTLWHATALHWQCKLDSDDDDDDDDDSDDNDDDNDDGDDKDDDHDEDDGDYIDEDAHIQ